MANFGTHSTGGVVAGVAVGVAAFFLAFDRFGPRPALLAAAGGFVSTYLGAVLVDADMPGTIPFRWVVDVLKATLWVGVVAAATLYHAEVRAAVDAVGSALPPGYPHVPLVVLAAILGALAIIRAIPPLLHWATGAHRTHTHDLLLIGAGCLLGGAVILVGMEQFGADEGMRLVTSVVLPVGFFAGAFVHIEILDR